MTRPVAGANSMVKSEKKFQRKTKNTAANVGSPTAALGREPSDQANAIFLLLMAQETESCGVV